MAPFGGVYGQTAIMFSEVDLYSYGLNFFSYLQNYMEKQNHKSTENLDGRHRHCKIRILKVHFVLPDDWQVVI